MHAAKTQLSRLVDEAAAGEEIVIARNGKPAARLVAVQERPKKRPGYGEGRGTTWFAPDWEETDPELVRAFSEWSPNDPLGTYFAELEAKASKDDGT